MADHAIEIDSLEFTYRSDPVLHGLDLIVPRGITFGILGANGAGKTTLIRLLSGVLRPSSGDIKVLGMAPGPATLSQTGYMPQLSALYLELSVYENVDFFARMYGLSNRSDRRQSVDEALDFVGLSDRRSTVVSELSGGLRQRLSLAVALVHHPTLLLLDEPTVGLDPEVRAGFWDQFHSMAASGTTIVISSHTLDDASHCSRLGFLRGGRFIAEGTPDELKAEAGVPDGTLEQAFLNLVRSD